MNCKMEAEEAEVEIEKNVEIREKGQKTNGLLKGV